MNSVVGIYTSRADAERAIERLRALGIAEERINCLLPGTSPEQLEAVPTTDAEQPGVGMAIGGVIGGAHGAFGGLAGAAVASALIPGIGPVMTVGLAAAALLGLGGAVAGAVVGDALENRLEVGLPKDELYVYEDALRQGRIVLIILAEDEDQADEVREVLVHTGAESIDAAHEHWWLGVRETEAGAYAAEGFDFAKDESLYRQGFEAALKAAVTGKSYDDAIDYLRSHYPEWYREAAFRRGYARGQAYRLGLRTQVRP
jgi:hypothetical protein